MSNINCKWLIENLPDNAVIFDIGCANLYDTLNFQRYIPKGIFYAFECSNNWPDNLNIAKHNNINYYNLALSDTEGITDFYQSGSLDGVKWPWSGSICRPIDILLSDRWVWNDTYTVPTTTLEKFCNEAKVKPDFIHIDVQGAEYKILSKLTESIKPIAIWAETSEFHLYETKITLTDFNALMDSLGYVEFYNETTDSLYTLKGKNFTDYISIKNVSL